MSVTQYIGARYVPLFADPAEWTSERAYEPLTIVQHQGNSYTSKQAVPIGIEIDNTQFWALTGNYNAQVEAYRQEVMQFADDIEEAQQTADEAKTAVNDEIAAREAAIAAEAQAREEADSNISESIANIESEIEKLSKKVPLILPGANAVNRFEVPLFSNKRGSLQGGCRVGNYDIVAIANNTASGNGFLQVYNGMQLVRSEQYPIDHGNSINFYGGNLYVTKMSNAQVLKIPFSNGNLGSYQTLDFSNVVESLTGCVYNGSKYYIISEGNIYEVESNLRDYRILMNIPMEYRAGVNQALSPWNDNGLIITRSNPNSALFISISDKKVISKTEFNAFYDYCYYDEMEQVQLVGDKIILYARSNTSGGTDNRLKVATVFESDLNSTIGSGNNKALVDGGVIFINLDYSNNSAKIPYLNQGTIGISEANPFYIKWACDIDAIVGNLGTMYDVRLQNQSDYPFCIYLENYSIHVAANRHVIESIMQRGGKAFYTGMQESFAAADNTNQKQHGGTTFLNVHNGIAQVYTNTSESHQYPIATVNSTLLIAQNRFLEHVTHTASAFLSNWNPT